ncbi:hypothetical protein C3492_35665 [Streptomyces sp. Ru62]|uniref:hypothetical protein n=1 Tax=Streptomyces sp. Ru62 TaxID=2080745 RepID=UPI000CDD709B|nr:hypothetical protein [Streptomyces sp. Ru62]POX58871.1 hypothetical protein C3492_35665 [Streptomyces sp. Ru62]
MTVTHLNSADGHGLALRARRHTTHVLRLVGDHISTVAVGVAGAGALAWMANDITEFAPVLNITVNMATLLILATWGTALLIKAFAYDVADWIDPDARDGDDLWKIAKDIKQIARDVRTGASYDDVRLNVQCSKVLPAVEQLLGAIGDSYDDNGEEDEASAAYNAALSVREAACHFGEKYGESA